MGASGSLLTATMYLLGAHAGQMLDGARDAAGHVEDRGDHLAGLPHLVRVRPPARFTTAREAPTAPPSSSAKASRRAKFSGPFAPARPKQ